MPESTMKAIATILVITVLLLSAELVNAQIDAYGGWTEIEVPSKDYFSLAEINDRHLFITPAGHAYFPLGVNHMSAYDNARYSEVSAFQDPDLARKRLLSDISYLNMNSGGGDSPEILRDKVPFFATISLTSNAHWLAADLFEFQDVFDPVFIDNLVAKVREQCLKYKDNKFLIGYYWTDTPRWDVLISRKRHLKDWVSFLRNQGKDAAGKRAYISFLEQKYQTVSNFNQSYGLDFRSFESMLNGRFDHIDFNQSLVIKDDMEFLGVIADHLYKLVYETIKQYDPNHLILGEKYIAGDHPPSVLKAAAKYVDVISIQPGPEKGPGPGPGKEESIFNSKGFSELYKLTEKPIMICDHTVTFYSEEYPVTLWHQFPSQQMAGEAQMNYLMEVAKTPYIVGYMNCQYLDAYDPRRGLLKQGILDKEGNMHQPYGDLIKAAYGEVLSRIRNSLN